MLPWHMLLRDCTFPASANSFLFPLVSRFFGLIALLSKARSFCSYG